MGGRAVQTPNRTTAGGLLVLITFACWLVALEQTFGATPTVSVEPCSLLTLEEIGAVIHGTATQDRPHVVAINKVPVGGNCVYRSAQNRLLVINLMVDAYPGDKQKAFENARRRPHVTDLPGLGDRAFTVTNPHGPSSVTFLRGMILVTINVEGLSIDAAKQLAALVAGRLPASTAPPPASSRSAQPSPPVTQGSGKLDTALVGSWFLRHPSGRSIANLDITRHGTFSMTVLAGGKMTQGHVDGENGVLHLYPDRGGHSQEIKYKIVDKNQMEWTDQKGNVTIARRQFR
ncbi:MAG: hypothetical protein AB7G48_20015 [Nitrospiraceae bacterium]